MAKSSIDIMNTVGVNALILLLNKYKEELPCELALKIKEISSGEAFCYKANDINLMMSKIDISLNREQLSGKFKLIADGIELKRVNEINTLLRTVKAMPRDEYDEQLVADGVFVCDLYEPTEMIMTYDDKVLMSWSNGIR